MLEFNPVQYARLPNKDEETKLKYFTPQQSLTFIKSLDISYGFKVDSFTKTDSAGNKYIVNEQVKHFEVP